MSKLILVTGGAGHIGSHVIEELQKNNRHKIISLDNYSNGNLKNHIDGVEYRRGHTKNIFKLIPEKPDIVYHLGEYARVTPSLLEPEKVYDYNIRGTFSVVEFCRQKNVKLIYAASSTKFAPLDEGRNHCPYSFSKAVNVDLINNYGRWYGLNYAICYFYNAFGGREKGKGKYATLIAKMQNYYLHKKIFPIIIPGTQKRNFTHVKDLAKGFILVGEKGIGDNYTLANKNSYSILEVAKMFGLKTKMVDGNPGRNGSGNIQSRVRKELGWETTIDLKDYINEFKKQCHRL